jgi:hypothetical protein
MLKILLDYWQITGLISGVALNRRPYIGSEQRSLRDDRTMPSRIGPHQQPRHSSQPGA